MAKTKFYKIIRDLQTSILPIDNIWSFEPPPSAYRVLVDTGVVPQPGEISYGTGLRSPETAELTAKERYIAEFVEMAMERAKGIWYADAWTVMAKTKLLSNPMVIPAAHVDSDAAPPLTSAV
jgi:hypothetical protein